MGWRIDRSVAEEKKIQPSKQTPQKSFMHNIIQMRSVYRNNCTMYIILLLLLLSDVM